MRNEIPTDACLGQKWNNLVYQMERPEVFYTYEWALAVQRGLGTILKPLLFLAFEEASLVGVVALAADAKTKAIFFLAATTADYCDFICDPERKPEFVEAVLYELRFRNHARLVFANLPADSTTSLALRAARSQGYLVFSRPAYLCAQVAVVSEDQRRSVSESAHRRLNRFRKALPHNGTVSIQHSRSSDEINSALPDFARAHVARFLSMGQISNLAQAARRDFLHQLADMLSLSGSLVLSRLVHDEHPIAWNFGFTFGGSWFWYQPTFDSDFSRYSPGVWLLTAIVAEACESSDTNRVDLGLGAEEYKQRLANGFCQTLHVTASRSLRAHLREICRYYVSTFARSVPQVEKFARQARMLMFSARATVEERGISGSFVALWEHARLKLLGTWQFLFLEWVGVDQRLAEMPVNARIVRLNLSVLAESAMYYEGDSRTLEYLLSAAKLIAAKARGFAVVNDAGIGLQFFFEAEFDVSRIEQKVYPVSHGNSNCVLIFNCWSPVSVQDEGRRAALSAFAAHIKAAGKHAWAVVRSHEMASEKKMEEAGLVRRFSATCNIDLVDNIVDGSPESKAIRTRTSISTAA